MTGRICIKIADGDSSYNIKNTSKLDASGFIAYLGNNEWLLLGKLSEAFNQETGMGRYAIRTSAISHFTMYDDGDKVGCEGEI
jgi:hypothetical protein